MTEAYDPENIFAKIIKGEIPSQKVYEDENTYAFLDIMPRADGHTLIIPKNGARNILDIQPNDLAAVIETVRKISLGAMTALGADGITVQQFNEAAGGQIVYHLHFHVIPRWEGVKMRPPASEMAENEVLAANAEKLRAALQG
ncbi:MAG: HIT family protein [Fimbriimonadaceae bacterium]|nr:HIT family protein [Alphaproteobacteria bacterium]